MPSGKIKVSSISMDEPMVFEVVISDAAGTSQHRVRMKEKTYQTLTAGRCSELQCVQAAFEFLLDREPRESILESFDISVISMYFSDFEKRLGEYLPA